MEIQFPYQYFERTIEINGEKKLNALKLSKEVRFFSIHCIFKKYILLEATVGGYTQ